MNMHAMNGCSWVVGADWTLHPWRHNCWGVTAGKSRHNSSNVGGVTVGQVRHTSSIDKTLMKTQISSCKINAQQIRTLLQMVLCMYINSVNVEHGGT